MDRMVSIGPAILIAAGCALLSGCAAHADFVGLRDQYAALSKSQDQEHKRLEAIERRMDTLENKKDIDGAKPKYDDLTSRIQKLESRLAKLEEPGASAPLTKIDPAPTDSLRSKPVRPGGTGDSSVIPGVPAITPTSAFNLAYNDYLNGKYDLAVAGFQRFVKDFPGTSLTPNAHYWLGESYYQQKDYVRAMQAFEYVAAEFPGNEKVPASLFKLGLAAGETGDLAKSKKNLKRVIEEFPTSDEAKLAKNKLADIR